MIFKVGDIVTFNRSHPEAPALRFREWTGSYEVISVENAPLPKGVGHPQWLRIKNSPSKCNEFSGLFFETDEYIAARHKEWLVERNKWLERQKLGGVTK